MEDPEGKARRNHVISRKRIFDFLESHPGLKRSAGALDAWYRTVKRATWSSFADVRETYGSADAVGDYVVFNVGGNKIRIVAEINYKHSRVYIRHVLTHAEYDAIDLEA